MSTLREYAGRVLLRLRPFAGLIGIILLMGLWVTAGNRGWAGKTLLASPSEVKTVMVKSFAKDAEKSQQVHRHAISTISRALQGWSIALGLGLAVGLILGSVFAVYLGAEPVVEFFRAIPPVLAFPLFLVAFDFNEAAYTWTVVFGCLPVMILTIARGTQGVSREPFEILRLHKVAWPVRLFAGGVEILPSVFLGSRITLSIALIIAVVTEMVFSPRSGWALGALARDAEIDFDTPTFYACAITIGLFGFFANALLRKLERLFGLSEDLSNAI